MKFTCSQCGADPGKCVHFGLRDFEYRTVLERKDRIYNLMTWLAFIVAALTFWAWFLHEIGMWIRVEKPPVAAKVLAKDRYLVNKVLRSRQ